MISSVLNLSDFGFVLFPLVAHENYETKTHKYKTNLHSFVLPVSQETLTERRNSTTRVGIHICRVQDKTTLTQS